MEYLVSDYTEVWVPSPVIPLIQFADRVRSIQSTGLDLVGIPDHDVPDTLRTIIASFDSVVSWYGSTRSEYRHAMLSINPNCEFHAALPRDFSVHATDFFAAQVGAPLGLIPRMRIAAAEQRDKVVIHPFSGSKKKNWPLDCYRELAVRLPLHADWLAGPKEELHEAHRFDDLADLAAFIVGARLYIGNDSGITHLAAAAGVKTLAIFGSASPPIWFPRGGNVHVIAVDDLLQLDARTVAHEANRLLHSP